MKKLLGIVVLSLLWCNVAATKEIKIIYKNENSIKMTPSAFIGKQKKISATHCAKYKKFTAIYDPNGSFALCTKKRPVEKRLTGGECKSWGQCKNLYWTNYDPNHEFAQRASSNTQTSSNTKTSSTNTDDKIAQSKQICKDLGFKTNTEKFADCALKMMSMNFEATNKVSSGSGTSQQIIVQQPSYDVWDALLDMSYILQNNNSSYSSGSSGTKCVVNRTNSTTGQTVMNCY